MNKLIKRIKWDTRTFSDFSQLKLVDKEISFYLKAKTINLIEKKLQNCFESLGLFTFYDMKLALNQLEIEVIEIKTISIEEYKLIFNEQYIIFM